MPSGRADTWSESRRSAGSETQRPFRATRSAEKPENREDARRSFDASLRIQTTHQGRRHRRIRTGTPAGVAGVAGQTQGGGDFGVLHFPARTGAGVEFAGGGFRAGLGRTGPGPGEPALAGVHEPSVRASARKARKRAVRDDEGSVLPEVEVGRTPWSARDAPVPRSEGGRVG